VTVIIEEEEEEEGILVYTSTAGELGVENGWYCTSTIVYSN